MAFVGQILKNRSTHHNYTHQKRKNRVAAITWIDYLPGFFASLLLPQLGQLGPSVLLNGLRWGDRSYLYCVCCLFLWRGCTEWHELEIYRGLPGPGILLSSPGHHSLAKLAMVVVFTFVCSLVTLSQNWAYQCLNRYFTSLHICSSICFLVGYTWLDPCFL